MSRAVCRLGVAVVMAFACVASIAATPVGSLPGSSTIDPTKRSAGGAEPEPGIVAPKPESVVVPGEAEGAGSDHPESSGRPGPVDSKESDGGTPPAPFDVDRQGKSPSPPRAEGDAAGAARTARPGEPARPRGAPTSPDPAVVEQPDGSSFTAVRLGDGRRNWLTDEEGAALAEAGDGTWYYAEELDQQGQLVPGDQRPDEPGAPPTSSEGLQPSADEPSAAEPSSTPTAPSPRNSTPGEAPPGETLPGEDPVVPEPDVSLASSHKDVGSAPTLVILAEFSDIRGSTSPSYWSDLWFGGSGSIRDFYGVASYGQLDLVPAADTSGADDGVVGWVNLGAPHPPLDGDQDPLPTVRAAIRAADPFVDFSRYDTNGDRVIQAHELHVTIILAGAEAAIFGSQHCGNSIWAHRWTVHTSAPVNDGVTVGSNGYTTFGELHCGAGFSRPATIGVQAHEFGHDLGMPDLYDIDRTSEGVGNWSLMGGGTWNSTPGGVPGSSPALPDAWLKSLEGWVTPSKIATASDVVVATAATTADVKQLLDNPGGPDWRMASPGVGEYFLIENRQQVGYDVGLPGCGLLIWHIDESRPDNTTDANRLVDLEEADGRRDLDLKINRGDDGDPWPGSTGNTRFSIDTNPSSRLNNTGASGVTLTVTSGSCAPTMTMDVGTGAGGAPVNDGFSAASTVAPGATVTGDTTAASIESGEPYHAANRGGASLWWKVTPTTSGSLVVDTSGSDFDTLLSVYRGSMLTALSGVADNDDASGLDTRSRVRFNVVAGTTYSIAVDGYRSSSGETARGSVSLKLSGVQATLTPPANDAWSAAATLPPDSTDTVRVSVESFGASAQLGEPSHAGQIGGSSVWWKFTPPASGTLSLDTRTSGYDTLLGVYTGSSLAGLSPVPGASNDDEDFSTGLLTSWIDAFPVEANTTYYVAVDGYAGVQGEVVLRARYTSSVAPTPPTPPTGVVAEYSQGSVLVSWEAPSSSGGSPILRYVVTASPGDTERVLDVDPLGALQVAFDGLAAGDYSFVVRAVSSVGASAPSAASNTVTVPAGAPANDRFDRSAVLTTTSPASGSNVGATLEPSENPHASNAGGSSVWWHVVAPSSGSMTIDTMGSGFDTLLSVYTGAALDELVVIAENDDADSTLQSKVRFGVVSGRTYRVAVDGYRSQHDPASGPIVLRAVHSSSLLPPPANDSFASATAISVAGGEPANVTGPSFGATKQPGEPLHAGRFGGSSVWWKVTAPTTGTVGIDTRSSGFDTLLAVYRGSSVSSLTLVPGAENDDEDYTQGLSTSRIDPFEVTAGQTYYIAVDGYQGAQGQVRLTLSFTPATTGNWYHPTSPSRVLDSRVGMGGYSTPWTTGVQRDVTVAGVGGVPADAAAVVMNVTVTNTSAHSYLSIWPTGQAPPSPLVSSMNWSPRQTIANSVTARVGTGGRIRVHNASGAVDVVIDVVGWYGAARGDGFHEVSPARLLDSRRVGVGEYASPWNAGTERDVTVAGARGVPSDASAVVLNITVTNATAGSFLSVWPSGQARPSPLVSSMNWAPHQTIANSVTATVGSGGKVRIRNSTGKVDVVIDVAGYFQPDTGSRFHPLDPQRILDSRPAVGQVGAYVTPWSTATTRTVALGGRGGVPPEARAVVANLTVTRTTAASYLSVWPGGEAQPNPLVSSLNWTGGTTIANAATLRLGASGNMSFFNYSGTADVVADVVGYYG